MYRKVDDFLQDWQNYANGTLQVYNAMTDEKLVNPLLKGIIRSAGLGARCVVTGALGKQMGLEVVRL